MPITSMTGFGSVEEATNAQVVSVEIKTLNSRFLEISLALPSSHAAAEMELRSALQKYFSRGRVSATVRIQVKKDPVAEPNIATLFAKKYDSTVALLQSHALLPGEAPAQQEALLQVALAILSKPLVLDEQTSFVEVETQLIHSLVQEAAALTRQSRLREGEKLEAALTVIGKEIAEATAKSLEQMPQFRNFFEERLKKKLADTLQEFAADDPRLALEVALQVERADCREELDRLSSHCQELKRLLLNQEAKNVGKELDFLAQEFARESSTLATKVQGTPLIVLARQLRILVEQLREQVQNIE